MLRVTIAPEMQVGEGGTLTLREEAKASLYRQKASTPQSRLSRASQFGGLLYACGSLNYAPLFHKCTPTCHTR